MGSGQASLFGAAYGEKAEQGRVETEANRNYGEQKAAAEGPGLTEDARTAHEREREEGHPPREVETSKPVDEEIVVFHTADWHLGRMLGTHDRTPDLKAAIDAFCEQVEECRPGLVVHAGDVFDTPRAPHEAVKTAAGALRRLSETAHVVVVAGNHDGYRLMASLDDAATAGGKGRLRLVTRPETFALNVRSTAGREVPVTIAAAPWLTPSAAKREFSGRVEGRPPEGYGETVGAVLRALRREAAETAVVAGTDEGPAPVVEVVHAMAAGARIGDSEAAVTAGEGCCVPEPADGEPVPDATAWGHVHEPHDVGRPGRMTASYCGSPVILTFGDAPVERTYRMLWLTRTGRKWKTAAEKRRYVPGTEGIGPGRKLVQISGTPDEVRAAAADGRLNEAILKVEVRTEAKLRRLSALVREGSPKALLYRMIQTVPNEGPDEGPEYDFREIEEKPLPELYAEWRRNRKTKGREDDRVMKDLFVQAVRTAAGSGSGLETEKQCAAGEILLAELEKLRLGESAGAGSGTDGGGHERA